MNLTNKINILLFTVLLIFIALLLIGKEVYEYQFNKSYSLNIIQNTVKASELNSKDIITNIVLDQKEALSISLNRLKHTEKLQNVSLIDKLGFDLSHCLGNFNSINNICVTNKNNIYDIYYKLSYGNASYGYLKKTITIDTVSFLDKRYLLFYVFSIIVLTCMITIALSVLLKTNVVSPINSINKAIQPLKKGCFNIAIPNQNTKEFKLLVSNLYSIVDHLKKHSKQQKEIVQHKMLLQVSSQVAHDIRSPLAALNVATSNLKSLPEEDRLLIRSAVQRIEDIANDLSTKKSSDADRENNTNSKDTSIQLISSLIDQIVSEKRTQFRDKTNLNIAAKPTIESYGLFAKINTNEFKRVISNIINNAVEALPENGNVKIKTYLEDNKVNIVIKDNGKGIPKDVLPQLTQKGATFGKEEGQGLGLFHARETVESWSGTLNLESFENIGTTVTISLPKQSAPAWFLPELTLLTDSKIVVLDDDDSIHRVWDNKFQANNINKDHIHHFKDPNNLINWFKTNSALLNKVSIHYLFDYELIGSEKTGLDVIESLNIKNNAVLVTSHFEEEKIRTKCAQLGVKLLPKNLAGYVPIRIIKQNQKQESDTYVLIDDNELIRSTWEIMARRSGAILHCFATPDDFSNNSSDFDKNTAIYIDSNLSNGIKGEKVAKDLYQKGFKSIYLATGLSPKDFPQMPWIKEVVGKDPPFEEKG